MTEGNIDTKRFDGDSWDLASSVGATRSTPEMYVHNGFEFPTEPSMVAFGDIEYLSATLA